MDNSTTKKEAPKEETLNFIKAFARLYRPSSCADVEMDTPKKQESSIFRTAMC